MKFWRGSPSARTPVESASSGVHFGRCELYEAENGKISIAVTGDAMISRRMSRFREPEFLSLIDLLRGADVTIANLEFLFHDFEDSWQWDGGGTYTRGDPRNLNELKWMGIDGVLTANNHSFDYSEG